MIFTRSILKFDRDLTDEEKELISLHGWESGLALGEPVQIESKQVSLTESCIPRQKLAEAGEFKTKRVEPFSHQEPDDTEARVCKEHEHLFYHSARDLRDTLQVEIGWAEWMGTCKETWFHQAAGSKVKHPVSVSSRSRRGQLQPEQVMGIPVVVTKEGGKAVLRPRWPETNRLVQGG